LEDDLPETSAQRQPIEPIFGPRISPQFVQDLDESLGWQERALCAETEPEVFFPESGGSTLKAKLVCQKCPVKVECLDYAINHDERFGIWGGLSERERRRLKTSQVALTERNKKFFGISYLRSLILSIKKNRVPGLVGNIPFDASDYAHRLNYRISSINDAMLNEIDKSHQLTFYPSSKNRLSTLIQISSLTKRNLTMRKLVFPDWEDGVLSFMQSRLGKKLESPRDLQIFAEEYFGLSVTLHPVLQECEFVFVANVRPGNISKGFALVNSNQESDLLISKSILRTLVNFLLAEEPITVGLFNVDLGNTEQKIFSFIAENYVDKEQSKTKNFKSKRAISPFLEAAALKALVKNEIDMYTIATELYEVSDVSAIDEHLHKSGWVK
jgi:WhiB family transcriptional regulator, redox-sensing transcriptional regulator